MKKDAIGFGLHLCRISRKPYPSATYSALDYLRYIFFHVTLSKLMSFNEPTYRGSDATSDYGNIR